MDPAQSRCLVHFTSPARWAELILAWVRALGHPLRRRAPRAELKPQVRENGMGDAVMTLDELMTGEETRGAGEGLRRHRRYGPRGSRAQPAFHGIHAAALVAALRRLEAAGKAKCGGVEGCRWGFAHAAARRLFKGSHGDDQGVKFSAGPA